MFPETWAPAVRWVGGGKRLQLWVVPGSSRSQVDGIHGDCVKIRVRAAPERGLANREVERLLSAVLGVKVRVTSGHHSRRKQVEIAPGHDRI